MTSMDRALMKAIEHVEEKVDTISTDGIGSSSSHTHVITDITNLKDKLDTIESKITSIQQTGSSGSTSTGITTTVIAHTHKIDDITSLQTELDSIKDSMKTVPYHSHEMGNIVNLTSVLEKLQAQVDAIVSQSASVSYPIGSIYFTTNTSLLTPRDEMINTRWVKVKSPLTNYTAWQRCVSTYTDSFLIEECLKAFLPKGLCKTIIGSDNVSNYITNVTTTNNFASFKQSDTANWQSIGTCVERDEILKGVISDKSSETTTGMLGDSNIYSTTSTEGLLKIFFPVGAMFYFKDDNLAAAFKGFFKNYMGKDDTYVVSYTKSLSDVTSGDYLYSKVTRTK